ncbi:hypothetical protein V6N13_134773 [Hibiscus sabdariffa]
MRGRFDVQLWTVICHNFCRLHIAGACDVSIILCFCFNDIVYGFLAWGKNANLLGHNQNKPIYIASQANYYSLIYGFGEKSIVAFNSEFIYFLLLNNQMGWDYGSIIVLYNFSHIVPCDGKRKYQNGDLRDKLDRRLSPEQRYSPNRDARDQQTLRGHGSLRSIDKRRNQKKKERLDRQSGFSEKLKFSNEIEDLVLEGRNISSTSKSILEDQLKEVHLDIDMLINRKHELETFVEEKVQEADTLTSQIEELASQLEKEKEECKRITSRIKKFVKAHNRCSQIENELKRSQARLQKSGEQLGLNISRTRGDEENSNINIVSDDEANGLYTSYPQKALRGNSSPSKKRLWSNKDITEGPVHDGKGHQTETLRSGKRSRWGEQLTRSNIDKENGSLKNGNSDNIASASDEKLRKGKKVSVSTSTADKLKGARASISVPSTSMAAHAVDDDDVLEAEEKAEASGLPFLLPPPPPILRNTYSQYRGVDEEMVHVDIV